MHPTWIPSAGPRPRRWFLQASVAAAAGFMVVPRCVLGRGQVPPSEKLHLAGIGIGGQGGADLEEMQSENIVALCD
ncbi:MAG TPA: gfo/Idh/MocA family oxidoreductase, partial [Verrucomicrobiota bacterium]|nr:gfo/Idh/MocA family oxidoreductase [Verrucomicrobiota bacterium]